MSVSQDGAGNTSDAATRCRVAVQPDGQPFRSRTAGVRGRMHCHCRAGYRLGETLSMGADKDQSPELKRPLPSLRLGSSNMRKHVLRVFMNACRGGRPAIAGCLNRLWLIRVSSGIWIFSNSFFPLRPCRAFVVTASRHLRAVACGAVFQCPADLRWRTEVVPEVGRRFMMEICLRFPSKSTFSYFC